MTLEPERKFFFYLLLEKYTLTLLFTTYLIVYTLYVFVNNFNSKVLTYKKKKKKLKSSMYVLKLSTYFRVNKTSKEFLNPLRLTR